MKGLRASPDKNADVARDACVISGNGGLKFDIAAIERSETGGDRPWQIADE